PGRAHPALQIPAASPGKGIEQCRPQLVLRNRARGHPAGHLRPFGQPRGPVLHRDLGGQPGDRPVPPEDLRAELVEDGQPVAHDDGPGSGERLVPHVERRQGSLAARSRLEQAGPLAKHPIELLALRGREGPHPGRTPAPPRPHSTARSVPWRTSASPAAPRWAPSPLRTLIASSRFVFPWPLRPTTRFSPGLNSTLASA